jgi:hypothetical protein
LGRVGGVEDRAVLAALLDDPEIDGTLLTAAADALGLLGDGESCRVLCRVLWKTRSSDLVDACRHALHQSVRLLEGEAELDGWQPDDEEGWRLEVAAGDPREAPPLSLDELRDLPRAGFEVIPLETSLRESQRCAWQDPNCAQFVQLVREA